MSDFTTIYLTEDIELTHAEIEYFERAIGREISEGDGFINVYTRDLELIQAMVDLIGEHYIQEIPSHPKYA